MQIKRLVLLLLVGQIADCITTIIFVGRGNIYEANPLINALGLPAGLALKLFFTALTAWFCVRSAADELCPGWLPRWILILGAAFGGLPALNNLVVGLSLL